MPLRLPLPCLATSFALVAASLCFGQIKPEVVLDGLKNPTGVAVQPETGIPFVAESGAGQIVRVIEGEKEVVVGGFPTDEYGMGPVYQIGPLGLAFLNKERLVVGDGSLPDGQEIVRVFQVPEPGKDSITADDAVQKTNPLAADGDTPGEGNFYGVAVDAQAIYVTANGDDAKGWVARAAVENENLGELTRYIATKEQVNVDAPAPIVITPRREILVGQMGEITDAKDSLITFYDQQSKSVLLNLPTELHDLVGLAYSPETGRLYAVDFSWADPSQGALYRLDAVRREGKQAVKAVKLIALPRPTSLAFAPSGELYITVFGEVEEGDEENKAPATGQLLKIGKGL